MNEFDFTISISLFCVIRSRWCYWFCNLEPKLTPRTFLFCPLGYLWLSSVLHLGTLVWVELFRQINWTPRMCTWMHGCFLCFCGFWVFVIFLFFGGFFFFGSFIVLVNFVFICHRLGGKTRSWVLLMQFHCSWHLRTLYSKFTRYRSFLFLTSRK